MTVNNVNSLNSGRAGIKRPLASESIPGSEAEREKKWSGAEESEPEPAHRDRITHGRPSGSVGRVTSMKRAAASDCSSAEASKWWSG